MTVRKAFRYRLYPNREQEAALALQFGHARFVYNWGLATRKEHYRKHGKGLGYYDLKRRLTAAKKSEFPWLADADSQVLQARVEDLHRAFVNFFEGRARYPRLHPKRETQSIRYPQRFKLDGSRIYLPKVGWVRAVIHRPLEGKPKSATVLKTKAGRYFVAIQCEVEIESTPNGKPVGAVDLGLTHFATLATSEKVAHPKTLSRSEKKLKRLQRQLSRKQKGSHRRRKARMRLARQHERVADQRRDFLHKLSHRVVTEHGRLTLETLNVAGMLKNHSLAKAISDSGWSTFTRFCEYKGAWYGCEVRRAERFFPSSKTCHACGYVNHTLTLKDRSWSCPDCRRDHDRDVNAALTLVSAPTVGATGSRSGRGRKTAEGFPSTQSSRNREAQPFTVG